MIWLAMTAAYQAGACNIGPAEIARRRRSAAAATGLAVLVAAALVVSGVPPIFRVAVLPLAVTAAVTWLQVIRRFCVAFGAFGIRNFGPLGDVETVSDPAQRAADRRTVIRMIVEGLAYGAIATGIVVLLPI
jgi:hypothetical protein